MNTINKIAAALKIGVTINNNAQFWALFRGVLVAIGVLLTMTLGSATFLSPDAIAKIIATAQAAGQVITALGAFFSFLLVAIPPIVASFKASPQERASDTAKIAADPTSPQSAAASAAIIEVVKKAGDLAQNSSDNHDLKVALLDSTAGMPEVVGKVQVTDEKLVQDTTNAQIEKVAA